MTVVKSDDDIQVLAAMWAARLDRGALSEIEQVFLDNWLAGDRRRLGALARAQASLVPFPDLDTEVPEAELVAADDERHAGAGARRFGRRRMLQMGGAMAAIAAGGVTFALLPREQTRAYRTGLGEVRMLPLADGSVVTLNTDSEIEVEFSSGRRTIRLVRGEALFDVAKDPGRSFLVQAGIADVTAIGTSFTVQRGSGGPVQVSVQDGVVEMAVPIGRRESRLLGANMLATAGEEGRIVARAISSEELYRDLAWREGKIAFSGTSLRQAVAEFNRYNQLKLEIDDETIAARTMTGVFLATNPKGFAEAVALGLEVDFYEAPERIVFIGRRPLPHSPVLAESD